MAKRISVWLAKCIGAGLCAVVILSIFSFFYYNTGRHHENPTGATSFVWDSGAFYAQMREGFSFGVLDQEGFNNAEAVGNPDVLIMGSSFMEGINLCQKDTAAYILNERLHGERDMSAYSIGLSSHNFYVCAGCVQAALEQYGPEYLVLETYFLPEDEGSSLDVINGNAPFCTVLQRLVILHSERSSAEIRAPAAA